MAKTTSRSAWTPSMVQEKLRLIRRIDSLARLDSRAAAELRLRLMRLNGDIESGVLIGREAESALAQLREQVPISNQPS